jgi:hypothetical protein
MFRKIFIASISVLLAVLLSSCGIKSSSTNGNNNSNVQSESKKSPEFLFILAAKKGEITKVGDNQYKLIINKRNFHEPVIALTDVPYRRVKNLSMSQLIELWNKGKKDSFKDDPPNASLIASNLEPIVIEINNIPRINKQEATYEITFKLIDGQPGHLLSKKLKWVTVTVIVDNLYMNCFWLIDDTFC